VFEPCQLGAYEPSEVVSESRHWTVLRSPDPVRSISCFYEAELRRRGWQARSSVVSARGATVVARRGPHGATISINDTGAGTAITIATY
jgi:hypothetical protein